MNTTKKAIESLEYLRDIYIPKAVYSHLYDDSVTDYTRDVLIANLQHALDHIINDLEMEIS